MNTLNYKRMLLDKSHDLRKSHISKDQIAIERNAELLDEIQSTADREIAMAFMTRDWYTASLVAEALERIETGEYGACAECEEPISERRLNALPWAKYCIRCQEEADQREERPEMSKAA